MRSNRLAIILWIIVAAVIFGMLRHQSLRNLRRTNAALAEQVARAQTQVSELRIGLETAQRELAEERARRDEIAANTATLAHELAPGNTEARWSAPPVRLPDWDPESPYVWLDKGLLTRFPVQPFSPAGILNPAVGSVLTLNPEQTRQLNDSLSRLVAEYRAQEAAHAQRFDTDIPGMQPRQGERLTIEIPPLPELGASLRDQFERTLVEQMGQSRADLILKTAEGWIREQLNDFGANSRILSVTRQPDNTYQVFIKTEFSQMSTAGGNSFEEYLPTHLRHLFAPLNHSPISETKP
ncbi:MAG TPA: hypothetical protein PLX89_04515 [Verrucomicrobiota bacterium]|nr:hypothetical protein [Verrucomicrobiales bacterium]HRI12249.1 hypothetical protein [Verrucomicrobiota bacterium]